MTDICALILAAGKGTRMLPLTSTTPKPLLPVNGIPLLDRALALVEGLDVAVNAHHLGDLIAEHVSGRAYVSREPQLLGSSGAVAYLREWIDHRGVLVLNGDTYLHGGDLTPLLTGWDGRTVRMLAVPAENVPFMFGNYVFAGASLLPWSVVQQLPMQFGHLVNTVWRPAEAAGQLELCPFAGTYIDCGTPADYAAANTLSRLGTLTTNSGSTSDHSDRSHRLRR